jgi:ATP-binding cassette subfamily B protein
LIVLVWPVDALGWILAMSVEARTAAERIFEVLDTHAEIHDVQAATDLDYCVGRISLEGVSFRYSEERDWVLRDISLTVEPGETLALVGKTGSGKTTLAMLVPRLYNVTRGRITLDGDDIGKLSLDSLRSHIGVAFEDPILFSASVKDNLLMGRPDASDEEIRSALSTAQAEFVYELPWGLETRVGEQGYTLSGGQRQRLALARAVLGKPRVLVLDDPLSSVDVHTEALIEEALESVLDGVTAILVVHRPSTLALADRVALLDEGRIVAVGSHHDLMEEHPLYRAVLSQEAEEFARSEVEDVHAG